jgi:phosphatidylcholine synthase
MPARPRVEAVRAYATHAFTATGAVFALLALLAAADSRWPEMFGWLVVALVVDGVDGALARRTDVVANAPIIDGVLLDLVIDFLTYVFVPAFALLRSGLLEGNVGFAAAVMMVFASALYFADTRMKTPDKSFSGFPAAWNMLALVAFVTTPRPAVILAVVIVLTVGMFLSVKFIHPVRTRRWRPLSLPVAVAGSRSPRGRPRPTSRCRAGRPGRSWSRACTSVGLVRCSSSSPRGRWSPSLTLRTCRARSALLVARAGTRPR